MIKNVSEITLNDVLNYLRVEKDDLEIEDESFLETSIEIAKQTIKDYTGVEDLDHNINFVIVVYSLVQDMWDNRGLYVDKNKVTMNKTVETILNMYVENFL